MDAVDFEFHHMTEGVHHPLSKSSSYTLQSQYTPHGKHNVTVSNGVKQTLNII